MSAKTKGILSNYLSHFSSSKSGQNLFNFTFTSL